MRLRHHRGNLLITVMIVLFATLMVGSMLAITTAQMNLSRSRAERAGDTESYVALANLCADAFKDELEAQSASVSIVSTEDPDGMELTLSVYDDIVEKMHVELIKPGTTPDEENGGRWTYILTDPILPIEYAGLEDKDFRNKSDDLLKDARLSISVDAPFSVSAPVDGMALTFETGDEIYFDDITFTVILEKGTTQVIQHYRLSGEILSARYTPALAIGSVDGSRAVCVLESQSVSRNNTVRALKD